MSASKGIPEVFFAAAEFCLAQGGLSIKDLPGCWEGQVDAGWWIALNGHREEVKCSKGTTVPGYSLYVEWYGWPAGIVDAAGGTIAAGSEANEDALLRALKSAARVEETP